MKYIQKYWSKYIDNETTIAADSKVLRILIIIYNLDLSYVYLNCI